MQKKIDAVNKMLQENLIGIRVVKSFVREDYEIGKFKTANDNLTERRHPGGEHGDPEHAADDAGDERRQPGGDLVRRAHGLRRAYWARRADQLYELHLQILMSVMMISMVVVMSARAEASAKRVVEVLDTQVDIRRQARDRHGNRSAAACKSGKVEFRDAAFKYSLAGSGENVLAGISFTVQPGEIVGIVGGTGTGKTTLVHLIPRLYDVPRGAVLVDGVDVRDYALEALRERIGVVLQRNTLFSGTIRENLLWGTAGRQPGRGRSSLPDRPGARFHHVVSGRLRDASWARAASTCPEGRSSACASPGRCSKSRRS